MATRKLRNIHPGEVLMEEFLNPLGISQNALARAIGVPPRRINEIALGKRSITADTAVAAVRSSFGDELFPAPVDDAVAAFTGAYEDLG